MIASGDLYRMHDVNRDGVVPVSRTEAPYYNDNGYGIFWSVNSFAGARKIENLTRINSWAIDIDTGTKEEQRNKIKSSPVPPAAVIEAKRGFHVYWGAIDATLETWNKIVSDRLVPHYGADKNAKDVTRVLRAPGYLHLKDPQDPFLVREVFNKGYAYTAQQMLEMYTDRSIKPVPSKQLTSIASGGFWENVFALNCEQALGQLSGDISVNGDTFSFRNNRIGSKQIYSNNRSTSCWIDSNGKIGSSSNGGPSVYQWLSWYGHSPAEIANIAKRVFGIEGE